MHIRHRLPLGYTSPFSTVCPSLIEAQLWRVLNIFEKTVVRNNALQQMMCPFKMTDLLHSVISPTTEGKII